jgi:hypothetical protein
MPSAKVRGTTKWRNIIVSCSLFREKEEILPKHKTVIPNLQKTVLRKVESLLA